MVSLRIDFGKFFSGIEQETNEGRGPPPNPVEIAVSNRETVRRRSPCFASQIMVYVAGFIWAEIKQLYQEGLHQYMVGGDLTVQT